MVAFDPKLNETLLSYLHLTDKIKRKKRVIIYGRPNVARNSFLMIVEALNKMIESIILIQSGSIYLLEEIIKVSN